MRGPLFAAHPVYLKDEPRHIWPDGSIVLFPDLYLDDDFVYLGATPFLEHGPYYFADYPYVVWRHQVGLLKFARDHTGMGQVRHSQDLGILRLECGGGEVRAAKARTGQAGLGAWWTRSRRGGTAGLPLNRNIGCGGVFG